jgi:hypothetical protein
MTKSFKANETNVVASLQQLEIFFTIIIEVLWVVDVFNL